MRYNVNYVEYKSLGKENDASHIMSGFVDEYDMTPTPIIPIPPTPIPPTPVDPTPVPSGNTTTNGTSSSTNQTVPTNPDD